MLMTSRTRLLVLMPLILIGTGSGCRQRVTPPNTVPVSGMVMLNGEPAAGILVRFHPQFNIGRTKFLPSGESGGDGKFILSTGAGGNGAPPGNYLVTFEKPRIESDEEHSGIEMEVDELTGQFSDPSQSKWKVAIQRGDNQLEPFRLELAQSP
jgi:hypothetical protein